MNPLIRKLIQKLLISGANTKTVRNILKGGWEVSKKLHRPQGVDFQRVSLSLADRKKRDVVNALKSAWHRKIQPLGVETRKLSKDVSLRREPFLNIPTQRTARGYFSTNKSMPMIDIDFPGGAHLAPQVVHANRKEALRAVKDFLKTRVGKKHRFEVYDTPAGMRLFDVSTRTSPERYDWLAKVLGSDKYYRWASKRKGTFDARLSPKPGRVKGPEYPEGDFVARRLTSIGKGAPLKYSQNELKWFHDNIIRQTLANSNPERTRISMGGLFDLSDLSKVLRG